MGDRKLLQAAAKAAGIELFELDEFQDVLHDGREWNPLTDDGDALRLAVKLRIDIYTNSNRVCQAVQHETEAYGEAERGDDPYAATRLAIVRTAAALAGDREQS